MTTQQLQKPGIEEWLRWAEIVLDRLTDCIHIYKKPPHVDVFMPDAERQHKTETAVKLLHRIHALADKAETTNESAEQIITSLVILFGETLGELPRLSADMQKLLKSPWQSKFPNKQTQKIFAGDGDEAEGIGSGHPEHARLPEALFSLLEREQIGDSRQPHEAPQRQNEPSRHDMENRERWTQKNSRFVRTAGRVE
jgi:hypothetical protein